jgi:hypothetical protein
MTLTSTYHLPNNSYWVCNSKYNGLSQLAKHQPLSERIITSRAQVGVLKNTKISTRILNQLQ